MKNLLYSGLLLTATLMAACSSEDNTGTESQKGMTLYATVSDTRASMTMGGVDSNWSFAFTTNDVVKVNNDAVNTYYTFTNNGTNNGTNFTSSDAKTTSTPAKWYAYFPGNEVSLAGQNGDSTNVANYYALSGATTTATTGAEGLNIHMTPQMAVLRIVKTNNSDECDINVKMGDNWVSSLTAKTNEVGFNVTTSTSKVSLLNKNGDAAGTYYYVAVPAGVKIAVYNGDTKRVATKANGLTAGKYYTVTTSDVSGTAEATIGGTTSGTTKKIGWVQLWAGGPKFATENVADKMLWDEARETGDNYVWGKNWRTPTNDEMTEFVPKDGLYGPDYENINAACTATYKLKDGVYGVEFTGKQPGYTKSTLFLPTDEKEHANYLTSSDGNKGYGSSLAIIHSDTDIHVSIWPITGKNTKYYVRPVLAN